jgi:CheY-like chemotaxis protein
MSPVAPSLVAYSPLVPALIAAGPKRRSPAERGAQWVGDDASTSAARERRLFVIEDNAGDVDLVREALDALPFNVDVSAAHDGEQAVTKLRELAQRGTVPHVIFLDLNLPRMSGQEVLAQLKMDPVLRGVPVVVLTSSSAEKDRDELYALHADEFVTKPSDVYAYFSTIQATVRRWLECPGRAKRRPLC